MDLSVSDQPMKESLHLSFIRFCMEIMKVKDMATFLHTLNVYHLAQNVLSVMDQGKIFKAAVEIGSALHDFGKIALPKALLMKNGLLDNDEMGKVRTHPVVGYEIVKQFEKHLPTEVLEIVLCHHERNGGIGYPNRIQNLPLHVEAVAVCDIAAAMQEHRPHRNGYTLDVCINELHQYVWSPQITQIIRRHEDAFLLQEYEREILKV